MGVQGLIITEEMVPNLEKILTSAGIDVEKKAYPEEQVILTLATQNGKEAVKMTVPNFSLHCKNEKGERVKLTFGRFTLEPYVLSIGILPLPQSLWKTFIRMERNKLVDQIISVLKENGAKDFYEVLNTKAKNGKQL